MPCPDQPSRGRALKSNPEPRSIPILFSSPMVNALLEHRKFMTRRLAWRGDKTRPNIKHRSPWQDARIGDTLWVREMFCYVGGGDPGLLLYGATWRDDAKAYGCDNIPDQRPPMKPGIHMPRAICRILLPLWQVRVEPLHAITDSDAILEGVALHESGGYWVPGFGHPNKDFPYLTRTTPRDMFAALWDALHGSGAWLQNPDVVVLRFDKERHGRV